MEAGNRCFDANVPEELNRKIVDRISDFNLVYTEHARRHLLAEGAPHRRVYLTGSPMREVLEHYAPAIERSSILTELGVLPQGYFLSSFHREENVDSVQGLRALLGALNSIAADYDVPIIVSTHPRTKKRLAELTDASIDPRLKFCEPFGFIDYNKLQQSALCVLSDSGTICEEAAILGFPAVTVRRSMERPEGLDSGAIMLTGLDSDVIRRSVQLVVDQHRRGMLPPCPAEYMIKNVSQRVVRLIVGTARLSNAWDAIVPHEHRWPA
jgi:UDP-N-acetyl-L-fucosamine synthase